MDKVLYGANRPGADVGALAAAYLVIHARTVQEKWMGPGESGANVIVVRVSSRRSSRPK